MKKSFLIVPVIITIFLVIISANKGLLLKTLPLASGNRKSAEICRAYELLKNRKDNDALAAFEKIINYEPDNPDALWGKAEVLRRNNDYKNAEAVLSRILEISPLHPASLNSLAYIRYKQNMEKEALAILNKILGNPSLDKENKAMAYVLLGMINSSRSERSGVIGKLKYGTQIKKYFLMAKELSPDLPEVHLALGSFYLLAPKIIGGDLDKAIEELQIAVNIASDFATANARLAQGYKMKGMEDEYRFYLDKAKRIDPKNSILKEIE